MCADENSTDKKTYRKPDQPRVSSRGFSFTMDEQNEKMLVKAIASFLCGFCDYPVMGSWHFCPLCGGLLEWKAVT